MADTVATVTTTVSTPNPVVAAEDAAVATVITDVKADAATLVTDGKAEEGKVVAFVKTHGPVVLAVVAANVIGVLFHV